MWLSSCLTKAVVALFQEMNHTSVYLGTAFFVSGKLPRLISAAHNLPRNDQQHLILFISFGDGLRYEARIEHVDSGADLAILSTDFIPIASLILADPSELAMFDDVAALEYSETRSQLMEAESGLRATPSARIGCITRFVPRQEVECVVSSPSDDMLLLSFPAMPGASGAPVVRRNDCHVVGVIVQSWSLDATPAKVEEVVEEDVDQPDDPPGPWPRRRIVETRRYLIPQALAANVRTIRQMLAAAG